MGMENENAVIQWDEVKWGRKGNEEINEEMWWTNLKGGNIDIFREPSKLH